MSDIKRITNYVASFYDVNATGIFDYQLQPQITEQPDYLIIRQVSVMLDVPNDITASYGCNISCDITNMPVASVFFPYNSTSDVEQCLTFVSNPQTTIQITKPLPPVVRFTMSTINSSQNLAAYTISICFDLVTYLK